MKTHFYLVLLKNNSLYPTKDAKQVQKLHHVLIHIVDIEMAIIKRQIWTETESECENKSVTYS